MSNVHKVSDVAAYFTVTEHTVLGWIRSGELRAINVGRQRTGGKPRWRITTAALEAFEAARAATPPAPKPARRRRQPASEVIRFY